MLFASCCTHSTTNDSDVVTVKDGEQPLGAEQAEQATIDAKKTDRAAVETVEEMLRLEEGFKEEDKGPQGEETSTAKQAVSEVDPIKEIISSVAPMVRNRVGTHSKQNPMTSKRFTVAGAKAAASPPGSFSKSPPAPAPTDATRSSTASAAMRNTAVSQAGGSRGTQRTTQRTSQMSSRYTRRARGSAMSSHSSASAMFLTSIGIDVRRRGRGSVISHHHGRVREDFDLLESLGVGGFGEVFRAQRKQDGHICAIKSVDLEKTDPEVFQIELDQARQLKHPNVVRLLTAYRDETAFWLVMELYPGGDLTGEILKNNFRRDEESGFWVVGIPDHRLARYAYQIFSGLAYLHYHKIVHRDIKPENFMRTTPDERESQLVLIDLGVSANLKVTPILNETVGTLTTIAPELFLGDYDEKCDLWSVGMTLYMCAVCMEPWQNAKGHMSEEEMQACLENPEWEVPYDERRWFRKSPEVTELVKQLLQRDPNVRPRAREVLATNQWIDKTGEEQPGCCGCLG